MDAFTEAARLHKALAKIDRREADAQLKTAQHFDMLRDNLRARASDEALRILEAAKGPVAG